MSLNDDASAEVRCDVWSIAVVVDDRSIGIAQTLELNLDRYPTKPAMLTYLQCLLYAAEANDVVLWQLECVYAHAV